MSESRTEKQQTLEEFLAKIRGLSNVLSVSGQVIEVDEYSCSAIDAAYVDRSRRQDH